jgi:hypothetical protein
MDMVVGGPVVMEIEVIWKFCRFDEARLSTYLTLAGCQIGRLMYFDIVLIKEDIERRVIPVLVEIDAPAASQTSSGSGVVRRPVADQAPPGEFHGALLVAVTDATRQAISCMVSRYSPPAELTWKRGD